MYLSDAHPRMHTMHTNTIRNHTTNGATPAMFTGHQLSDRIIQVRVHSSSYPDRHRENRRFIGGAGPEHICSVGTILSSTLGIDVSVHGYGHVPLSMKTTHADRP